MGNVLVSTSLPERFPALLPLTDPQSAPGLLLTASWLSLLAYFTYRFLIEKVRFAEALD